ncbi:MAG: DUF1080 domain-containing protein [Opitutales bacterium]
MIIPKRYFPWRLVLILAGLFAGTLSLAAAAQNDTAPPPAGFSALFNGSDLSGWWGLGTENPSKYLGLSEAEYQAKREASLDNVRQHWRAEEGVLINDGKGLYLTTEAFFGNFELLLEYQTVPKADSGIYLRGYPQVQIWDSTEKAKFKLGAAKGSGGLWNNSKGAPGKDPLLKADKPFGEWNQLRIIMVGSRVWVWLNGAQTVDGALMENYFQRDLPLLPRGPIQLQTHGGQIAWRNIFIREIGSDEANRLIRGDDPAGFKAIFNGKDLSGWTGATDACHVRDGVMEWIPGKSGNLFTEEEYADFILRFEFKLAPGGNNGLALRYPGKGNPAYAGMCELQVLDDKYDEVFGRKIDPRQAHASVYGMVAARRGYQHPIGEWNYQEVTVKGSTIQVELNGTPILDADLSQVTEFMQDKEHPGKDLTSGHFGLAGHHDPAMFRKLSIQRLP